MATLHVTRRSVLAGMALGACAPQPAIPPGLPVTPEARVLDPPGFAEIETRVGGRLGVAAWNTGDGAWLYHRPDERFAMCSMFKWLLAAQALQMSERTSAFLSQQVRFNAAFLEGLGHAPVTRANLARGWMSVEELCRAAVVESDNGAANLLLDGATGPAGVTQFLRDNGDSITRLDRNEPSLNENLPGDERDTTTPRAMAQTAQRFLLTDSVLNTASREKLTGWLIECQTGLRRLRAGLPTDWRAGDKTGTSDGAHNATTDVAIAWPQNRPPIIIAMFLSDSVAALVERNAAHADVARIVAEMWS